jgi:rSAM/selenodomain-associated transferase 1
MQARHRILDPAKSSAELENLCALAVMTKAPRAGHVKTRLVPPLTHNEAAQLNVCFLRDTAAAIKQACDSNAIGVGVYTPVGSESEYTQILPLNFHLLPQRGDGFGQRLAFAVDDLFRCGFASVCLIDSDSPTVRAAAYREAIALLSQPGDRVILGPSDDGGYYLVGLKENHRELFEHVDWSTERVLEQTKQRAGELALEVSLLATGYDIDDAMTLRRLGDELLSEQSDPDVAPDTRKFLAELMTNKSF